MLLQMIMLSILPSHTQGMKGKKNKKGKSHILENFLEMGSY